MANFYYIEDKVCSLVDRNNNTSEEFILESPNGDGVYKATIESINDSRYVDGSGRQRKGFTEYDIKTTFYYSSHTMELIKLLNADEIVIPFSLGLNGEVDTTFILLNREAVYEYFADKPLHSTKPGEPYPYGSLELEFVTAKPMTFEEVLNLAYYREGQVTKSMQFIESQQNTIDRTQEGYDLTLNR